MAAELVLIRGLPGSGKSTLARHLTLVGYLHLEADHYFERRGPYKFDASLLNQAHSWCRNLVRAALADGKKVAVSNTFTRKWELDSYAQLAWAIDIAPQVITCRDDYGTVHDIPNEKIQDMRDRWEEIDFGDNPD